jgi:hypothetical protein
MTTVRGIQLLFGEFGQLHADNQMSAASGADIREICTFH